MNRPIAHQDDGICIQKETMLRLSTAREVRATAGCGYTAWRFKATALHNFKESCHVARLLLYRSCFPTYALNGCLTRVAVLPIYVLSIDQ